MYYSYAITELKNIVTERVKPRGPRVDCRTDRRPRAHENRQRHSGSFALSAPLPCGVAPSPSRTQIQCRSFSKARLAFSHQIHHELSIERLAESATKITYPSSVFTTEDSMSDVSIHIRRRAGPQGRRTGLPIILPFFFEPSYHPTYLVGVEDTSF